MYAVALQTSACGEIPRPAGVPFSAFLPLGGLGKFERPKS